MRDYPLQNHSINLKWIFKLICMQKSNFITHFFFKLLQRNNKLVILGNLGIPCYTQIKWYWQFEEGFDVYLLAKNQLNSLHFPWDIAKILQTCYSGYFGHWLHTPKVILTTCRKLSCLSPGKKSTLSPMFFWRYCKDMQIFHFGYFGHAWLRTCKVIASTCRKPWCLSACLK